MASWGAQFTLGPFLDGKIPTLREGHNGVKKLGFLERGVPILHVGRM